MTSIAVADARNEFDRMLELAQIEPVHIQENGRDIAVVLSPAEYERLLVAHAPPGVRPRVVELLRESLVRWDEVYKALAK